MITANFTEKLNPKPFDLVGANRREHPVAGGVEIGVDEVGRKRTHRQLRRIDAFPEYLPVAHRDRGRDQPVSPPRQATKMFGRAGTSDRLVETFAVAFEHLVATNDDPPAMPRRHRVNLRPSKPSSSPFSGKTGGVALQRVLVDIGLVENGVDSSGFEHGAAGSAAGGQDHKL